MAAMTRSTLSVVMFVKNEERRIAAALETVRWADDLVIIDDASQDRTAEICRAFGARVIPCEDSQGYFYKRRNFGFSQASGDWILMMDPDERVSAELRQAVAAVLERSDDCAGYTFWRRNHFWNRALAFGGWRQKTLHLFRRGRGGDRGHQVHSPIEVDGPVGHLDACMDHFPFDNVSQLIEKQNFYTSFEASELAGQAVRSPRDAARRMILRPLKVFWKTYVKKRGFADGFPGLILSILFSWVEFLRWAKCWEMVVTPEGKAGTPRSEASAAPGAPQADVPQGSASSSGAGGAAGSRVGPAGAAGAALPGRTPSAPPAARQSV